MKKILMVCLIFVLSACGSKPPPETQYFVLTPNVQPASVSDKDSNNIVVLEAIQLAEYLDQPGIVLQTDVHQIQVAHYHRWAEPLKPNLHRYILETLNDKLPNYKVQSDAAFNKADSKQSLHIKVNQFNGTKDGSVILSGHWMLNDLNSKSILEDKSFHFEETLANDGYTELVNQLATLLEQLCSEIAQSI